LTLGCAQRRLVVALSVSLALHAWLMQSQYGKGAARGNESRVALAAIGARILPVMPDINMPGTAIETPSVSGSNLPEYQTTESKIVPAFGRIVPASAAPTVATAAPVLSKPSDPIYYAVGDLDVFPKALVRPDLGAALGVNHEPAAGKVRATVLIDEVGIVNAVRNVDAFASDIETVVRELLLRTRFTPARNKEGSIVKAQVLVALDYDTRAAPASR
jgi:hypothetical protein